MAVKSGRVGPDRPFTQSQQQRQDGAIAGVRIALGRRPAGGHGALHRPCRVGRRRRRRAGAHRRPRRRRLRPGQAALAAQDRRRPTRGPAAESKRATQHRSVQIFLPGPNFSEFKLNFFFLNIKIILRTF